MRELLSAAHFINLFPFSYSQWVSHLGFPITETQLHILKSAWPKLKVESWFKLARKVFVKRLFWFLNNTWRDWMLCVLRLPEENILFSNLIFIILPFSVLCRHSEAWIHYANTLHKHFRSDSNFFLIQDCRYYFSAKQGVLQAILTLWFHFLWKWL